MTNDPWGGFTGQGYGMTKPMQLPSNQGGFGGINPYASNPGGFGQPASNPGGFGGSEPIPMPRPGPSPYGEPVPMPRPGPYGQPTPMPKPYGTQEQWGGMPQTKPMQVQPDYSNIGSTGGNMYQPQTKPMQSPWGQSQQGGFGGGWQGLLGGRGSGGFSW